MRSSFGVRAKEYHALCISRNADLGRNPLDFSSSDHSSIAFFQNLFKFGNVSDLGGSLQEVPQAVHVSNG
jgi:hypothetical protein